MEIMNSHKLHFILCYLITVRAARQRIPMIKASARDGLSMASLTVRIAAVDVAAAKDGV
jgi:hypothetical protein